MHIFERLKVYIVILIDYFIIRNYLKKLYEKSLSRNLFLSWNLSVTFISFISKMLVR